MQDVNDQLKSLRADQVTAYADDITITSVLVKPLQMCSCYRKKFTKVLW